MKRLTKPTLAISLALILLGCSKNNSENSPATYPAELHTCGVLAMQPEQWSYVPEFSTEIILENARTTGLPVKTLPSGYLLASPTIRNQGQICSCAAFCGAETNEILNYYKTNTTTYSGLTVSTVLTKASSGVFIVQNSWGSGWGYKGYFYMPYSVLRSKTIVFSGSVYVAII